MKPTACRPGTPAGTPAGTGTAAAPSPGERELVPVKHDVRICSNSKAHGHQCRAASRMSDAHGADARAGGDLDCAQTEIFGEEL
jgi:hypothetical protein